MTDPRHQSQTPGQRAAAEYARQERQDARQNEAANKPPQPNSGPPSPADGTATTQLPWQPASGYPENTTVQPTVALPNPVHAPQGGSDETPTIPGMVVHRELAKDADDAAAMLFVKIAAIMVGGAVFFIVVLPDVWRNFMIIALLTIGLMLAVGIYYPLRMQYERAQRKMHAQAVSDPASWVEPDDLKLDRPVVAPALLTAVLVCLGILGVCNRWFSFPLWLSITLAIVAFWPVAEYFKESYKRRDRARPTPRQARARYEGDDRPAPRGFIMKFLRRFRRMPGTNVTYGDFERIRHLLTGNRVGDKEVFEDVVTYMTHPARFYLFRWTVPLGALALTTLTYVVATAWDEPATWTGATGFWYPLRFVATPTPWLIVAAICLLAMLAARDGWHSKTTLMTKYRLFESETPPSYWGFFQDNFDDPLPLANVMDHKKAPTRLLMRMIHSYAVVVYVIGGDPVRFRKLPNPFVLSDRLSKVTFENSMTRGGGAPSTMQQPGGAADQPPRR